MIERWASENHLEFFDGNTRVAEVKHTKGGRLSAGMPKGWAWRVYIDSPTNPRRWVGAASYREAKQDVQNWFTERAMGRVQP